MKVPLYTFINPQMYKANLFKYIQFTFFMHSEYWENKGQSWTQNYLLYFISSCANRIAVSNDLFALVRSQPREKQNRVRDFMLFKYFLNNLLVIVFMQKWTAHC